MNKILKLYNELNQKQKQILFISIFGFIVISAIIISWNFQTKEVSIDENIALIQKSNAQKVIKELKKENIPFKINEKDGKYLISTEHKYSNKAKLKLATININTVSNRGWNIFDKSSLGKSSFENNVNLIRAMEGEIEKALETLDSVKNAKISIAKPKDTLFIDKPKTVKVSAVLTLKDDKKLNGKQILGIKRFIANSIPDLDISNINIIDQTGFSLEEDNDEDISLSKGNEQFKYKKKLEIDLEKKLIEVISPVVGGKNNIQASVTIDLNFKKENSTEEIYDPNSVVRSEKISELSEKTNSNNKDIKGVPGAISNIQRKPNIPSKIKNNVTNKEKNDTVTNYEISKKVKQTNNKTYGFVNSIGASISFNTLPFKPEQIKIIKSKIENLVKSSINYNKKRGDKVAVEGFEFFKYKKIESDDTKIDDFMKKIDILIDKYGFIFKYLIVFLLLFIFYKKVILKMNEIKIVEVNNEEETKEEYEDLNKLKEEKIKEKEKKEEEEKRKNEEELKRIAKIKLEEKIRQELNSANSLSPEEETKFNILLSNLHKNLSDKEEVLAKLLENLIDTELEKK